MVRYRDKSETPKDFLRRYGMKYRDKVFKPFDIEIQVAPITAGP